MKSIYKSIGELVERIDQRNTDGTVTNLIGVSIDKKFINSVANVIGTDLTKYKVIEKYDFAVSLMQVSRDEKIPVACQKEYDKAIMSPAYPIFRVKDTSIVLPEYLEMWFMRPEFDREASFIAVGGVRGSMPWEDFANMKLPVPSIEEQREIVEYSEQETEKIGLLKREVEKQIEYLREYRTRLISDVVTGQIDVRDVVIPEYTPEEDAEIDTDDIGEDVEEVTEDAE